MSNLFEDRERGYEAKWAHDEETHFKILSMRNARLAYWAAELMGLPVDKRSQYSDSVIASGVADPKDDPVFKKIKNDLMSHGIDCPDPVIRDKMKELYTRAEKELTRR